MNGVVAREWMTLPHPVDLMAVLAKTDEFEYVALLDTAQPSLKLSPRLSPGHRWSYLCLDPSLSLHSMDGHVSTLTPTVPKTSASPAGSECAGDVFTAIDALLRPPATRQHLDPEMPPFRGGLVGWLGYELCHVTEDIPLIPPSVGEPPVALLVRFDTVLAVDHSRQRTWILATGRAATLAQAFSVAQRQLACAQELVRDNSAPPPCMPPRKPPTRLAGNDVALAGITSKISPKAYQGHVEMLRGRIRAGDALQVCLTRRCDSEFRGDSLNLYRMLRTLSPEPMAAFLRFGNTDVLSSSPERFLSLDRDRWVETRPIKGTRPRGTTVNEDVRLRQELACSAKDLAENIMIVDLARNDLGRVCEYGTITVPELQAVEAHAHTHQMVSTIRGQLCADQSPLDLVRAAFPPGSMTGAPKVAAMRFIAGIEPTRRGIYSGALGWFDLDGVFDLSVVIRTLVKQGDKVQFHVGGAVVADSDPLDEYQETLDKARGLVLALTSGAISPPACH